MDTELPTIVHVHGLTKADIPFSRNENDFHILDKELNQFFCSLNLAEVTKFSSERTIEMRDFLEGLLSKETGKPMEMGFAEEAFDTFGELTAVCYFQPRKG